MSSEVARDSLLTRIDSFIGDELREVEKIFYRELDSWHPYISDILRHATRFRGKRLRPILLLLSAKSTGGINDNHRVLAAVVEMIHSATLIHDDVLDEAKTRRHIVTVNSRWNTETSVLFGDYLFTHSFHLASSLESTLACRLIGRATNVICEGELSQIHERGNCDLSEECYFKIIDRKTAELCAICCRLGAHYGQMDEGVVKSLADYGRSLGIAFQIADDVLDLVGNEHETGKSLGTDLKKKKMTLPLIRLLERCSEQDTARIRDLLARPDDETWPQLAHYLDQSDAIEYSQLRAGEYAADAARHLDKLPDSTAKQLLEDIVHFVTQRSF